MRGENGGKNVGKKTYRGGSRLVEWRKGKGLDEVWQCS